MKKVLIKVYHQVSCIFVALLFVPFYIYSEEILPEDSFPAEEMPHSLVEEEVVQIAIKGNLRVAEEKILNAIKTKKGSPFSIRTLRDDLKRIYSLGFFQDVSVDAEPEFGGGLRLTFILKEKPIVSKISFIGNKKIKESELKEVIALKEKDPFDEFKKRQLINTLTKFYKDKGYYWALIKVEEDLDELINEVKLNINIKEGKIVKIKRINFNGNKAISTPRLLWYMETKLRGIYKEEELAKDIERLYQLYADRGYILVRIFPPEVVYDEKMKGFVININIDEAEQFRLGKITFTGNTLFTPLELEKRFVLKPGQVYSLQRFRQNLEGIKDLYAEKGYIEAQLIPEPSLDRLAKRIDFLLHIQEGERYYLEGIKISGNVVTKENVIRREVLITPGEVFDGKKVSLSRQRIFNLGYFDTVEVEPQAGTAPNKKILNIRVKERKTGMATLGAGYSSRDGLVGNLEFAQINLFGRGWKTKISANFGGNITRYNFSFLNPWLFDKPNSFGFNLYDTKRDRHTYTETHQGGDITLGSRIGQFNRILLTHKREDVIISGVTKDAPRNIEEGRKTTNSLVNNLIRDTTDSPIDTTRGYRAEMSNEYAGEFLGGDVDFYKPKLDLALYIPLFWKLVLSIHKRWSIVTSPKEVPDYERFYLGGANSIRGYRDFSIHPKDEKGNDIGGEGMFFSNIELGFLLVERTLRTCLFFDAGNTWLKPENIDLKDLKCGVGLGVLFYSPMGPIRLDYGYPIGDPKHKEPQFHFGIGPIF